MPLHRDIHWIGRQWAVTGHGMQLIDQKLKGFFDIDISQLREEALIETMRAKEWLNRADFDKGLEVARKRFPKDGAAPSPPPAESSPARDEEIAPAPVLPVAPAIAPKPVVQAAAAIAPVAPPSVVAPPIAPIEPPPQIDRPAEKPAGSLRLRIDPVKPPPAPKPVPKSPAAKSPAAKSPALKSAAPKSVAPTPPAPALPPPGTMQALAVPTPELKALAVPPIFHMLFAGEAKFVRPWRVRVRK